MVETYNCAMCGKEEELTTPKANMEKEVQENFGDFYAEDCDIVCDNCYKKHFEFKENRVIIKK